MTVLVAVVLAIGALAALTPKGMASSTPTMADQTISLANAAERLVEGSPVIVLLLLTIGWVVWQTWRSERRELLAELREEREARARSTDQAISAAEKSTQAVLAVRDALGELRQAIATYNGGHRG